MPRKKTAKKPKGPRKASATTRTPLQHCIGEILSVIIMPRILTLWEQGHRTSDALRTAYNATYVLPFNEGPISKESFKVWVEAAGFRAPGRDLVPTPLAHENANLNPSVVPTTFPDPTPVLPRVGSFDPSLLRDDGEPATGPLSPPSEVLGEIGDGGLRSAPRELLVPPPDPLPENHPDFILGAVAP